MAAMSSSIVSVSLSPTHSFSKHPVPEIVVEAGLGIAGDAHAGATVRHRYMVRRNPRAANLCQVHLLQSELFAELAGKGLTLVPGDLGENVTTTGLDLLNLPLGTRLHLGAVAVVQVTGLRQPCTQMNDFRPGLMQLCLGKLPDGKPLRKAGIMAIALASGTVRAGDAIAIDLPPQPHIALGPV